MWQIHIPAWTKQQFVNSLLNTYPNDKTKFNRMRKVQLIKIFINVRRRHENS